MKIDKPIDPKWLKNNRIAELCAAILTGFGLWWLEYSLAPKFLRSSLFEPTEFRRLFVKVSAFVVLSLALSLWKNRFRNRWGWIAIAVLGLASVSVIDEIIYRLTSSPEQLAFMPEFSPFPLEIVLWFWPTLLFMAAGHYLGATLFARESRLR
jgi:phosphoglycerol transferase MdoB-like AlkP superfamily enzyme